MRRVRDRRGFDENASLQAYQRYQSTTFYSGEFPLFEFEMKTKSQAASTVVKVVEGHKYTNINRLGAVFGFTLSYPPTVERRVV
jgi:hypothetical protein